jgi:hypothetical protein
MRTESLYLTFLQNLIKETRFQEKFLSGSGCCLICYISDPLVLEEHHVGGRANSNFTITVCANHHQKLSRMQKSWPPNWASKKNAPEVRKSLIIRGISDLLRVQSEYQLENRG